MFKTIHLQAIAYKDGAFSERYGTYIHVSLPTPVAKTAAGETLAAGTRSVLRGNRGKLVQ